LWLGIVQQSLAESSIDIQVREVFLISERVQQLRFAFPRRANNQKKAAVSGEKLANLLNETPEELR